MGETYWNARQRRAFRQSLGKSTRGTWSAPLVFLVSCFVRCMLREVVLEVRCPPAKPRTEVIHQVLQRIFNRVSLLDGVLVPVLESAW